MGSSSIENPENFIEELKKSIKQGGVPAMLIGHMDISRLMDYVQNVEDKKLRDREEFSCFKCVHEGHFMKECPKNSKGSGNQGNRAKFSSIAPLGRAAPKGTTSGTSGGANCLYAITSPHEQNNSPNVVTGIDQNLYF
ncbi:DNA-binding protein HEXBP-like [Solanum pennellii]|uniref:DNA-binding protein HEXBP-like n=1 Tax=Solanum pennellii TaxID=28526 RepID=A0ABM1GSS9_SOLPN|nr:DNA-binding protein HEXBP-like [Solanum pennellii]